jgi:hypothetical protein
MIDNVDSLSCTRENVRLLQQAMLGEMMRRKEILARYYSENSLDENTDDTFAKGYAALRENTTPLVIIIESVADFCAVSNPLIKMGFRDLFEKLSKRNMYVIGCFEPDIPKEHSTNTIFTTFSRESIMMFGGQLGKQSLYNATDALKAIKDIPFNVAVMQYRNSTHTILMPCGKIEEKIVEEDMESIF